MFPIPNERRAFAWGLLVLSVVLLIGGSVLLYLRSEESEKKSSDLLRAETSGAQYKDLDGNPVSFREYLGQPVLVFSWASWSPQSEPMMRGLLEVVAEGAPPVIAINRKEERQVINDYLAYVGIDGRAGLRFVVDPGDMFYRAEEEHTMPVLVLYDRTGTAVRVWRTEVDLTDLRTAIAALSE